MVYLQPYPGLNPVGFQCNASGMDAGSDESLKSIEANMHEDNLN